MIHMNTGYGLTYYCKPVSSGGCGEEKPVGSFLSRNKDKPMKGLDKKTKGLCSVCRSIRDSKDQSAIRRERSVLFAAAMREANKKHVFLTERELRR